MSEKRRNVFLVTFWVKPDLWGRRFNTIVNELLVHDWCHYIPDTWLIATSESLEELSERLKPHFGKTDKLLITPFSGEVDGWMPKEAWDWIRSRCSGKEVHK